MHINERVECRERIHTNVVYRVPTLWLEKKEDGSSKSWKLTRTIYNMKDSIWREVCDLHYYLGGSTKIQWVKNDKQRQKMIYLAY